MHPTDYPLALRQLLLELNQGTLAVHDLSEVERHTSELAINEGLARENNFLMMPLLVITAKGRAAVEVLAHKADSQAEKPSGSARRTGRPAKGETGKEMLVISALARHHKYEPGGSVGN
jgi:hypothetical protein